MPNLTGILTREDDDDFALPIRSVETRKDGVTFTGQTGDTNSYPATGVTWATTDGTLTFDTDGVKHTLRSPREDDGEWLSKYKTWLPVEAVNKLISGGNVADTIGQTEDLTAYAMDDSPYILGLVYTNAAGTWVRVDNDWVLMSPEDRTFSGMTSISIDPERAQDFLKLYDNNFVTIDDADEFEDPALSAPITEEDLPAVPEAVDAPESN